MTTVFISLTSWREVTRDPDPEDSWDAGDEDGDVSINSLSLSVPPIEFDQINTDEDIKPGDTVWLVSCVYGTGSTFGSSGGYFSPLFVSRDKAGAKEFYAAAEVSKDYDVPWNGYFEWLQHLDCDEYVVGA